MKEPNKETPVVFEVLQEPLNEALQATDTLPPAQNETLSWHTFVRVVVYYFIAGIRSGRLLLTHLAHADPALHLPNDLKKSTFFEAFRRFRPDQARQLFAHLLSRLAFFPVPEIATLGLLCAALGSHWPALQSMTWAAIGSHKPTVLLHLAFGLNSMIPVSMLLTESNFSERRALRKMIHSGVTYIADRGYFAFYLLHEIAKAQAFFVIRSQSHVRYTVVQNRTVEIPEGISWLEQVQDLKVNCEGDKEEGLWRMVRFRIGESFFVLFTNRWDLTTWQIITIYAYRWQIELFFLFAKRKLHGLHLLTHSPCGLEIQFYLLLISSLLLLYFQQRNDAMTQENTPTAETVSPLLGEVGAESTEGSEVPGPRPTQSLGQGGASPEETGQLQSSLMEQEFPGRASVEPTAEVATQSQPKIPASDPAPSGEVVAELAAGPSQARSVKSPSLVQVREETIVDAGNAQWYRKLGEKLRKFWKISVHWLQVLRDNLARVWNPEVFQRTPGLYIPSQ
jgi:hypothetical protein